MHNWIVVSGQRPGPDLSLDHEGLEKALSIFPEFSYFYRSRSGHTQACFWGQETTLFPKEACVAGDEHGLTFFDGYVWPADDRYDRSSTASNLRRLLSRYSVHAFQASHQGEYVVVHIEDDQVLVVPDPLAVEPCYYCELEGCIVYSNRVNLIKAWVPSANEIDLEVASFHIAWGIICEGMAPWKGVRSVEVGSHYVTESGAMRASRPSGHPLLAVPGELDIDCDSDAYWDKLAHKLMRNLDLARDPEIYASLGLSGGKDSRLILALALGKGVAGALEIFTNGVAEHPDVVVATEICDHFGLPHFVRPPPTSNGLVDINRIHDVAFKKHQWLVEGMHPVWDPHAHTARYEKIILAGMNGEWYRSTFDGHGQDTSWIRTESDAAQFLTDKIWLDPGHLMNQDFLEFHREWRRSWCHRMCEQGVPPDDLPNLFYVLNQSSRRNSHLRKVNGASGYCVNVLSSNDMIRLAFTQGPAFRRMESIHFRLMSLLSPWLAGHRFAMDTWPKELVAKAAHLGARISKPATAVRPAAIRSADWRTYIEDDPDYRAACRSYLLDQPAHHSIFQIVERRKIETFFEHPARPNLARMGLYGLITVAMMFNNELRQCQIKRASSRKGVVVRRGGDAKVYRYYRGELSYVPSPQHLKDLGFGFEDVVAVDERAFARLTT